MCMQPLCSQIKQNRIIESTTSSIFSCTETDHFEFRSFNCSVIHFGVAELAHYAFGESISDILIFVAIIN